MKQLRLDALSIVAILAGNLATVGAQTSKVPVLGMDGTRPDALAIANIPNIDALITDGT